MTTTNLPHELSPVFLEVISKIKRKITFDPQSGSFLLKKNKTSLTFEYVEELLTNLLTATELHYDKIGDDEFQRIFDFGLKALSGETSLEDSEDYSLNEQNYNELSANNTEEMSEDEEIEGDEEEEETPEDIHFALISEIIEEIKANPETDEEYLEIRIKNGLKMRGLEFNLNT